MLLISVDGNEFAEIVRDYERIGKFCKDCGATQVYVADNKADSERLWKIRRAIPEAFSLASHLQSGEDVVVPPASIACVGQAFTEIARKYGVAIPCYGHAGDGNLHARITPPKDWTDEKWYAILPSILRDLYAVVRKAGGRLSGEHGIGCKRKDYMACVVSENYLAILRAIKRSFDPNNIMNPGKIFDL